MDANAFIDVTACCIARKDDTKARKKAPKVVRGCVSYLPKIGASLVIFHRDSPGRTITSAVIRVLGDADGPTLYIETLNSIYRVTLNNPSRF